MQTIKNETSFKSIIRQNNFLVYIEFNNIKVKMTKTWFYYIQYKIVIANTFQVK